VVAGGGGADAALDVVGVVGVKVGDHLRVDDSVVGVSGMAASDIGRPPHVW
jgi:hypothetical protein